MTAKDDVDHLEKNNIVLNFEVVFMPNVKSKTNTKTNGSKSKNANHIDSGKVKADETDFIETYLKSDGSSTKTFFRLYKGHYGELLLSTFFFFF